jgi:drug/metabolite transporter (DMT)-like permease
MPNGGESIDHRQAAAVTAALVTVQVLFGTHYVAAKVVLFEMSFLSWAVIRAGGAAIVLLGAALVLRRPFPKRAADWGWLAVCSVFGVVINQTLFVAGLQRTTPTHSSILATLIPVITLLFAVLLGREKVTRGKVGAWVVAFAGVLMVIWPKEVGLSSDLLIGDLLVLTNFSSFAFFLVISKRLLERLDLFASTAVLFVFGSLGIAAIGGPQLASLDTAALPAHVWWLGLYIILGPTVGTYILNYYALARVDSSIVALFIYLQPLVAAALSAGLLGERPSWNVLVGGALVFVAVYLAVRQSSRAKRAAAARRLAEEPAPACES